MELLKNLLHYYQNLHLKIYSLQSLRWARRLVYTWVFVNYAILATRGAYFYSADSYIPKKNFAELGWVEKGLNLLSLDIFENAYPFVLFSVLLLSILALLEVWPRTVSFLIYFLVLNLDNKASVILDGGNNLMHLILFYLIFVNVKLKQSVFSTVLTNLSALMIKLQVVFVYATAGLLKVMGPLWAKGVALYYTMGVAEYGNENVFQILSQFPVILSLFTLGTVLFQVSFPYLIWNRSFRPYLIFFGTCLHLSISFVMGLFMFGLAMCVSYSFFKTDSKVSEV